METKSLDWSQLRVFPLEERDSMTRVEEILRDPDAPLPPCPAEVGKAAADCAARIRQAREKGAGVMLIYGAHLLRNGAAPTLGRMMQAGWVTHLATNGAGTIHDWEYSWLGRSTESVRKNVAVGRFGSWDETGRNIMTALIAGGLNGEGYGAALGRYICEDGATLPGAGELAAAIKEDPSDPLTSARADALRAMEVHGLKAGRIDVHHQWKHASVLAQAYRHGVPMTVHPGIGYDIIVNHPMYDGGVVGRAATIDCRSFGNSVETLDGGVVLSIGSAIMAPQVFEKSLSAVNNLRISAGRPVVSGHSIYVVDMQDGGNWNWDAGEPPKSNPAYYLRFCKSFARMGGDMRYIQADNITFLAHLYSALN
jgi:hypothetical protein